MAQSDLFRKGKSLFATTLSSGIGTGTGDTITLNSASGLPTDTEITLTFDRVDANGASLGAQVERITGTISGNVLTNYTRAVDGTTEQAHSASAVIEFIPNADDMNDLVDGILVDHDQSGQHKTLTDTNGNEWIEQGATSSAVNQVKVSNAATGGAPEIEASGDDTNIDLDITPKGTGKTNITANDLNLATGANVQVNDTDPYRTITLPAKSWSPTTTSGCADSAKVEAGTNDIDYDVLDFDASSDESAYINFPMPNSYDGGVIQFRFIWTAAGGSAAQTVVMELSGRSFADDDAIDQAVGTPVEVSDALIATGDVHISAWSGDVTITGAGANELLHLELMRDVSEDNLASDARLIAVQIRYKQGQFSD